MRSFTSPLTPTIRRYLDISADGWPSKPKPRPGLRARLQVAQSEAEPSRGHAPAPPAHGVGGPRTRSASRNLPGEQRHRVASGSGVEGSGSRLTRSTSHNLLSHASSSSSLSKSESSRHQVLSKPSRPGQYAKEGELSSSTRRMPPPSRTASQSSDRPDDESHQTRSAFAPKPALRPLRQALSADSMAYASASADVPASDPPSQPSSSTKSTVKERVSELEKKAEANGTPTAYRLSPSKQDLASAAAIPLPEDSPVVANSSLAPSPAQLPESPSFAMLLNRQSNSNDVPEMPTLLDLSMTDVTITAQSDTPGRAPRRQLSQHLRDIAPSPGSVAQLIGRFSSSSETPNKATPRSSTSPLSGAESTPTSRAASKTSPLSAEPTGSFSTPSQGSQRRISPLPHRASSLVPSPESPNRSLKRKGSDIELSFTESTPVARSKAAPRFSQPLIAFGDTPRRQSMRPFVFGGAGVFDDLMGIQTGEGEEDEIVHEGFTQLLEGLVVGEVGPAGVEGDLLALPVPAALSPVLEPEATGETADLLDFGDEVQESTEDAEPESADKNDATVVGLKPEPEIANMTVVAAAEETSDSEAGDADTTVLAPTTAADTPPQASPAATTPQPTQALSPAIAPKSELSFDIDVLAQSMAATTLKSPASKVVASPQATAEAILTPLEHEEPVAAASLASPVVEADVAEAPTEAKSFTPVHVIAEETALVPPTPGVEAAPQAKKEAMEEPPKEQPDSAVSAPVTSPPAQTATSATDETVVAIQEHTMESPIGEAEQPAPTAEAPPTAAPAAAQPMQPPVVAPPRARGHMRSTTAPVRSTTTRLGPPSKAARPGPGEKKPFKPVSRLGVTDSSKSAPAPARLAMATKTSQAKAAAAPVPARQAARAPAPKAPSAPSSKPPSRGPSRPASRAVSRAASPIREQEPTLSRSTTIGRTAASEQTKPPAKPVSNLLRPTAAAAARAAATIVMKEKEPAKEKPNRPPTAASARAPATRVVSTSRPASSLFAPTAASRARAEPALPPSKRQRVKLKAPMESFKPGRARLNPSKAAVLGQAAPRRGRDVRAAKKVEKSNVDTFPLPGPQLASAVAEHAEVAPAAAADERAPSLSIPAPQDEMESGIARTPKTLSPLAHSVALSPASSRHTDRSYDSSKSSPRNMRPSPSRPLDPVLTPLHHTLPGSDATPRRPGKDTPATAHARRISGIPASIQRSASASKAPQGEDVAEDADVGEKEEDGVTSVVRHDVSTPQGKATILLAKFSAERRALTARDGNKD